MKRDEIKKLLADTFGALSDKQIMALTIYGEARGEAYRGKVAVGSVILERVDHRDWDGKTAKEVCLMPYQFSCFLPDDPNFKVLKFIAGNWNEAYEKSGVVQECYQIASGLIEGTTFRTPEIAANHICQYKTKDCHADWAEKMKLVVTIGRHEFYAEGKA